MTFNLNLPLTLMVSNDLKKEEMLKTYNNILILIKDLFPFFNMIVNILICISIVVKKGFSRKSFKL